MQPTTSDVHDEIDIQLKVRSALSFASSSRLLSLSRSLIRPLLPSHARRPTTTSAGSATRSSTPSRARSSARARRAARTLRAPGSSRASCCASARPSSSTRAPRSARAQSPNSTGSGSSSSRGGTRRRARGSRRAGTSCWCVPLPRLRSPLQRGCLLMSRSTSVNSPALPTCRTSTP